MRSQHPQPPICGGFVGSRWPVFLQNHGHASDGVCSGIHGDCFVSTLPWQRKRQCQLYRSIMLSSSLGWINFVNPCPAPSASRDGRTEDTTLHTASPAPAFREMRTTYVLHLIQIMHVVLVPGMAFHAIFDASLRCLDVSWSRMCISILTREDTENHADPHSTNSHPNHHPFFVVAFLRLGSLSFSSWAPHLAKRNKMRFAVCHVSGAVQALSVPSLQSFTCHCGNHHLATSTWAYLSLLGIAGSAYGDMASETTSFPLVPTGCRAGKFDSANAQGKVAERQNKWKFSYVETPVQCINLFLKIA